MSVDTTVVILDCLDGFQVATFAAVGNITQHKDVNIVNEVFSSLPIFTTLEDAYIEAQKREDEHQKLMGYTSEYGIIIVKWDKPIKRKPQHTTLSLNKNDV